MSKNSAKSIAAAFRRRQATFNLNHDPIEIPPTISPDVQPDFHQEHQPMEAEFSARRRDIARGKKPMTTDNEDSNNDSSYDGGDDVEGLEGKMYTTLKSKIAEGVPQDNSASEYLAALFSRGFKGTRFPHKHTMQSLGIYEDVITLFKMAQIDELMSSPSDAYQEETCYFLATLQHHEADDDSPEFISFSVRGEVYAIMIEQLDEVFGFPHGEEVDPNFSSRELTELWKTIGVGRYSPGKSKGTNIRNPVVRYYHKSVANTIFGRHITGCVNEGELGLIDLALKPILRTTSDGKEMKGDRANSSISRVMIKRMLGYKEWAKLLHRKNRQGDLTIGGIITPILRKCNVPLRSERHPPRWIELNYLKKASFFEGKRDEKFYIFLHPRLGESRLLLPNVAATTIRKRENIDFQPNEDVLKKQRDRVDASVPVDVVPERPDVSVEVEMQEPECYYFDDSPKTRKDKSLAEVHKKLSKIQKWQKFQDKYFKKTIKDLTSQIKNLVSKVSKGNSSGQRRSPSQPPLARSHSTSISRQEPRMEQPHRHSSVEPETMQRRKRHHSAREDPGAGSSLRFQPQQPQQQQPPEQQQQESQPPQPPQQQQPEVPGPNLRYTTETMKEYLDATLFIPF